jgi:hypothetical protein
MNILLKMVVNGVKADRISIIAIMEYQLRIVVQIET